ncbi:MAG: tetratricopeptide repeat protein [Planctomycetota bacterium]|jgi:tetratricopeptide (TPR) repeat protein
MNRKNKNVMPGSNIMHRASSRDHRLSTSIFHVLCFLFLSFCFLTSFVTARTQPEQLSPTDFLLPYLNQTFQDVNTPIAQIQDAKFSPSDFLAPYLEKTLSYTNTPSVKIKDAKAGSIPQEKLQAGDTVAAEPATEINQKLPQINSAVPAYISTQYGRQLWRARISAYQEQENNKNKSTLKRLIEQIRSIEFKPKKRIPEPVITIKPAETTVEPNENPSVVKAIDEIEKMTTEPKSPYEPVTSQTLQMLAGIAQDSNQLENPFELGEVLYTSGNLREAAVFYQEALNRIDAEKTVSYQSRPWILFQLGNCLRDHDLSATKKIYVQLITEYPESPWVDLAKARVKVIDWYLKDKPETLIAERQL